MLTRKRTGVLTVLALAALTLLLVFAMTAEAHAGTYHGKYWLKVNKQRNVITAYEHNGKKWKPVRAMLCSTGTASMPTASGTYYSSMKRRWLTMTMDGNFYDYAQYTCNVYGQVYIHSVWYYAPKHNAQATKEFNKLGTRASHGCIRVSVADAKWIYDNCPEGTKITIYSSSKAGPLGKPKGTKVNTSRKQYWDPTDPAKGNPYYIMRRPVLRISPKKKKVVNYGSKYKLKSGVTAKDPNSFMSLTKYVKVKAKYHKVNGRWKKTSKISTRQLGAYRVTYYVNDPWGRDASKSFVFRVKDLSKPAISGAKDQTVTVGTQNAVRGVTATQKSGISRTKAIQVTVREPGGKTRKLTWTKARTYTFQKAGRYTVTYTAANKADASARATVKVRFNVTEAETEVPTVSGLSEADAKAALTAAGFQVKVVETELTAAEKAAGSYASMNFGTVISQSQRGTAPKGSTVRIRVLKEKTAEQSTENTQASASTEQSA